MQDLRTRARSGSALTVYFTKMRTTLSPMRFPATQNRMTKAMGPKRNFRSSSRLVSRSCLCSGVSERRTRVCTIHVAPPPNRAIPAVDPSSSYQLLADISLRPFLALASSGFSRFAPSPSAPWHGTGGGAESWKSCSWGPEGTCRATRFRTSELALARV